MAFKKQSGKKNFIIDMAACSALGVLTWFPTYHLRLIPRICISGVCAFLFFVIVFIWSWRRRHVQPQTGISTTIRTIMILGMISSLLLIWGMGMFSSLLFVWDVRVDFYKELLVMLPFLIWPVALVLKYRSLFRFIPNEFSEEKTFSSANPAIDGKVGEQ